MKGYIKHSTLTCQEHFVSFVGNQDCPDRLLVALQLIHFLKVFPDLRRPLEWRRINKVPVFSEEG